MNWKGVNYLDNKIKLLAIILGLIMAYLYLSDHEKRLRDKRLERERKLDLENQNLILLESNTYLSSRLYEIERKIEDLNKKKKPKKSKKAK